LALHEELAHLRTELDVLEKQGELAGAMKTIRERVARLERRALATNAQEAAR
jgi:hypothetical protein